MTLQYIVLLFAYKKHHRLGSVMFLLLQLSSHIFSAIIMASPERHFNMTGAPGIELQDIGPNPTLGQLISEAQHRAPRASQAWKRFSRIIGKVLPDPATRRIRRHEPALEAAIELHPECPQFRADYYHLRDRPCAPVESLFHLIVIRPPDVLNMIECHPSYETCLSDWLESIHGALVVESSDSLILW